MPDPLDTVSKKKKEKEVRCCNIWEREWMRLSQLAIVTGHTGSALGFVLSFRRGRERQSLKARSHSLLTGVGGCRAGALFYYLFFMAVHI